MHCPPHYEETVLTKPTQGTTAKAAVRFLSFDTIRNSLSDERGKLSASRGILAGMVAGAVESMTVVTPTERVKTALSVLFFSFFLALSKYIHISKQEINKKCRIDDAKTTHRFRSGLHASQTLIREAGVSELFRGLISTTLKQSATSAVRMGTYNILKETVNSYGISPGVAVTFGTGAMAGVVTVYATQPFDTVKTRAQGARGVGIGEATRSVVQDYGIGGFWKGSSMRLGRLLLSGGIVFSVYEQVASLLGAAR